MDRVADEPIGEDEMEGSGCFLGRPGPLLFFTATLAGVGTLLCCPRLLESPCKPAVTEMESRREGVRQTEAGGEGGVCVVDRK